MTERTRAELYEEFEISLILCLKELNDRLPELDARYGAAARLQAMAEHVGRGLRILINRNICDAAQAHGIIARITSTAFPPEEPHSPSRR